MLLFVLWFLQPSFSSEVCASTFEDTYYQGYYDADKSSAKESWYYLGKGQIGSVYRVIKENQSYVVKIYNSSWDMFVDLRLLSYLRSAVKNIPGVRVINVKWSVGRAFSPFLQPNANGKPFLILEDVRGFSVDHPSVSHLSNLILRLANANQAIRENLLNEHYWTKESETYKGEVEIPFSALLPFYRISNPPISPRNALYEPATGSIVIIDPQ